MRTEAQTTLLLFLLMLTASATALAEIVLTIDKAEYEVGEIVHIAATNTGPEVEQFVSSPFFVIFNADLNECVMGCVGLPVITPFLVGETVSMDWDTGLGPDAPGNHAVGVAVAGGPTVFYLLTDAVNVESSSWGNLKALYRD